MSDLASSSLKVQLEANLFDQPVSESSLQSIGALANYLREQITPIGTVFYSMLTESQFQAQGDYGGPTRWILADGRSVTGSEYQTITGNANVPDLRGVFPRGKNNSRSDGNENPDGNLALGTFTTDKFKAHTHAVHCRNNSTNGAVAEPTNSDGGGATADDTTTSAGGNETAPKSVTLNAFIRIN